MEINSTTLKKTEIQAKQSYLVPMLYIRATSQKTMTQNNKHREVGIYTNPSNKKLLILPYLGICIIVISSTIKTKGGEKYVHNANGVCK